MRTTRMLALWAVIVALAGCKGGGEAPAPTPPAKPVASTPAPTQRAAAEVPAEELERRALVEHELGKVNPYYIVTPTRDLSERQRRMVTELYAAARVVDTLNALQIHPDNPRYAQEVAKSGSEADRALYARNQHPWCHDSDADLCTSLASRPRKAIGHYHWPVGMSDEEYEAIKAAPNKKELLSPFTIVRRDGEAKWRAVPFAADPLLGPHMKKLAMHLEKAAAACDDPSLVTFLKGRAAAFRATEAFPYDASDYHWIALDGDWEVCVGPYEVYKNPRETKARFEMYFGPVDEEVTAALAPFKANLQAMEEKVADLVGRGIYEPRKLDSRIAIRAMSVWYAAGDGRNPQGAIAAFHLPNRGASVDEGLYKKVMLVNHMRAFHPIMKARAKLILDPSLRGYVSGDAAILNVTFHEFCHGFGSHDELSIKTVEGKETTVHDALGPYTTLLEEEKADVLSAWLVAAQLASGALSEEQARQRYVSHLMHIFGLLQYSFKGTYPRMVAVQLGWYMDRGAVSYHPRSGQWNMDFDKVPTAVESLAKRVATIQLTGDRAAAEELVGRYVSKLEGGGYEPSKQLQGPLADVKRRFAAKEIKSISISYELRDL